jgi:hypothetical protein
VVEAGARGRRCVYQATGQLGGAGITSLELDFGRHTFDVRLGSGVQLSTLSEPVGFELRIGDASGSEALQMKQSRSRLTYKR